MNMLHKKGAKLQESQFKVIGLIIIDVTPTGYDENFTGALADKV